MLLKNNFLGMVNSLSDIKASDITKDISLDEYEKFKIQWLVDALKGMRYGESFCIFFNISNASPLYYFKDNSFSKKWIEDFYLNEK